MELRLRILRCRDHPELCTLAQSHDINLKKQRTFSCWNGKDVPQKRSQRDLRPGRTWGTCCLSEDGGSTWQGTQVSHEELRTAAGWASKGKRTHSPDLEGAEFCRPPEWVYKQILPRSLQIRSQATHPLDISLMKPKVDKPTNHPPLKSFWPTQQRDNKCGMSYAAKLG